MKTKMMFGQKELADLLGLSKQALYWRIKNGQGWSVSIPDPDFRVSATRLWTYETLQKSRLVPQHELDLFVEKIQQNSIDDLDKVK